jgi:hypothetical protein
LSHEFEFDAKFLAGLAEFDAAYARKVRETGCQHCDRGPLDRADYPRKARGELGEASEAFEQRLSFCCREEGCRKRSTPPSLRFLGRKVYFAVLVIVASVSGQVGRSCDAQRNGPRIMGVPARTVRRWLEWWQTVFALSPLFAEAKGYLAQAPEVSDLPTSLLELFGGAGRAAVERMLRFIAPVTTTSVRTRITMGA